MIIIRKFENIEHFLVNYQNFCGDQGAARAVKRAVDLKNDHTQVSSE